MLNQALSLSQARNLQIDTIHVVARSPYLVLFSRLGAYLLDQRYRLTRPQYAKPGLGPA